MKSLFQELHDRSLWQVIGIYLAGSWLVLQVVDQLTESAGLPEWVPSFALVLLLIGLPIVVATAFLQHRAPTPAQADATGGSVSVPDAAGDESSASPAPAEPIAARTDESVPRRLFTWRNAILGGVGAAILFGVVMAGWSYARNHGCLEVAHVIHRIEDTEDIHPVVSGAFDKSFDNIISIVTIAEQILAAQQHLHARVGHGSLEQAQTLPGILAQKTDTGIESRPAPCLE